MYIRLFIFIMNIYKSIRSFFPPSCRFQPTCSEYFKQAVLEKGFVKGFYLGTKRVLKCHPFHPGGHDPV